MDIKVSKHIKQYNLGLFFLALLFLFSVENNAQLTNINNNERAIKHTKWKEAGYKVLSAGFNTFNATEFANIFYKQKNSIVKIALELEGLKGIRLPFPDTCKTHNVLEISFDEPVKLLVGIFNDSLKENNAAISVLNNISFGKGQPGKIAIIKKALTVTGLPAADVYAVHFKKGEHTISWKSSYNGRFIFLGAIKESQKITSYNAELPDGRLWDPFIIEGFYDEKPLFEIVGGPDKPVIDEGMPGTEDIQGGFEGGTCVKIDDTYHMFPTERAGEKNIGAYYDRVKTRIGYWTSKDAIHWQRQSAIYQASGKYAVMDYDNPANDRRAAIWSYMPIFNKTKNRWYGYYLTYTVSRKIAPNHSFGRIWRTESKTSGIEGIGGPYDEGQLIMEPGLNSQLWEGRQGVASFYPFPVKDHWLAFYAGAYPFLKREDYPDKTAKGWFIGLAKSDSLEGPWVRLDTTINPIKTIHPWFVENPIVYQMPNGLYLAIFDGGPEGWGLHLPNMFGYTLSADGLHWTEAHYLPIQTKVKKWWNIMRTPLCLIPEGNDIYTILYAAIDTTKRFHPIGMVKVKLDKEVLDDKLKSLKFKQ
jgi:hypothetical protein